ncbi:MAG: potassium/proton antiporter [Bacteroidales bacterium]|nr:potassium/proton antiporter [Bacteroidales bacterium]
MQLEGILLLISILFFVSIIADKAGYRFGVPSLLLFLAVGMIFGSDGFGIQFDNIEMAQTVGTIALCVILFSGGMDTKTSDIKPILTQGLILSTIGVLLTALFTGIAIWFILGKTYESASFSLIASLLLGATMSSTDSASVFSILRAKGLRLKNNLKPMLELESGSNDPMAYILTITLLNILQSNEDPNLFTAILYVFIQLVLGSLLGFALGKVIVFLINKLNIENDSLYPILVLSSCIFIFSISYFLQGNCYLAVYVGGLVIGNSKFVHKNSTIKFFDGLTWLFQLLMFLILGLLVNPHELLPIIIPGLIISFIMIFVTRPLSVFISLLPFRRMHYRDKAFISWVGLRGATPIIFAILSLNADIPNARLLFNIVFFCTLVSLIIQGTSLPQVAKWLHLVGNSKGLRKPKHFDIDLPDEIKSAATEIVITEQLLKNGNKLMDIGLPEKTLAIMVKRDMGFFVPTGKSVLKEFDTLLVITDNAEKMEEAMHITKNENDS